ncbi:MAG: PxKF domain-containing protein [Thermomicrobiales bacterium]|nr:PxKF domain-containing protein [Thermomicrobiales bacterium]
MARPVAVYSSRSFVRLLLSAFLLAGLLVTLVPAVSRAASFTVTNTDDSGPGSLRQAVQDASGLSGDHTITFALNNCPCAIVLTSVLIISGNITIQGLGADMLTISGGNATRVFLVKDGVTATLDGLTISDGSAEEGGGIHVASSTLTITNSVFTGNGYVNVWGGWGGAINASSSTVTITNSTFSDNTGYIGAAIHSADSVLRIENTTVEHNLSTYLAGGVSSMGTGSATIVDSIFTNNEGGESGTGGGVYADTDLTVIGSSFSNNDAGEYGWGGGIAMFGGDLAITGSSFIENTADASGGYGGAIFTTYATSIEIADSEFVENTGWMGGAIYTEGDSTISMISSTFDRNHATDTGGAIYASKPLNIINSTFSGNSAKTGGGIGSYQFGSAADNVVANSTFSGNSAADKGNSIATFSPMTIAGSIFADQDGSSCWINDPGTLIVAEIVDSGYNLSSDATCVSAATSLPNADPLLEPLADNGGSTQTHALASNSPALDRIPVGTLGCGTTLTIDQRGVERPLGTACDIGAFEALADTTAPVITPTVNGTQGSNGWYTSDVTVSWSVVDDESAISASAGCDDAIITEDTAGTTLTCEGTSAGGTASQSVTIQRDATAPIVSVTGITDGAVYTVGDSMPSVGCLTIDPTSGVTTAAELSITGGTVGDITVTCAGAIDNAGNSSLPVSATYTVHYDWQGFVPATDSRRGPRKLLAGPPLTVVFVINGGVGLDAVESITSIACNAAPGTEPTIALPVGRKGELQQGAANTFIFQWKTSRAMAGTCQVLRVTLTDGTSHDITYHFL